jgi:methionyl-tRNA formyltransferase
MPRIAYAANRALGEECLHLLRAAGVQPEVLLLPADADHGEAMQSLLPGVPVLEGKAFSSGEGMALLRSLQLDYLLSIHFPLILPAAVRTLPRIGTLNLHPAYLPFNRGWHTPSWAILDGTPFGATLHWMDDGIDTGDIALQKQVEVHPDDTAHSLYQRALQAEAELFRDAIPLLLRHKLPRIPQTGTGTSHKKADLEAMRKIDPTGMSDAEMLRRVRALTTNRPEEAAYIEMDGKKHALCINAQGGITLPKS